MKGILTILLLVISNMFMTMAWYGHLKFSEWKGFQKFGLIAVILISKSKNIIIASLFPVISNGIILAIEFRIAYMANKLKYADFNTPIFINMATIAFGELVVVSILGVIVFKLLEKNKFFMKLIS
mgnify:CR=1 FL=1